MRKILFRGKRTDTGEWVEGDLFHNLILDGVSEKETRIGDVYFYGEEIHGTALYEVDPETVGQYTGLADRNGKKIFEGDIVKHYHDRKFPESYSKGVIFYDEEYLRWKRTSENLNCCIANDCIYEVIGNIHDNPDLLT